MSEKITREEFLEEKFESFKKQLESYLPKKAYKSEFEDILNQVKELLI